MIVGVLRPERRVDFNTEIRPVLNEHCIGCHGGVRQRSGLSFLFPEEAVQPAESGRRAIVAGNARGSELIRRIDHVDPGERMPPESEPLSEGERKLLHAWIDQGAEWDTHWAFRPPPDTIIVPRDPSGWSRNEIDHFVAKRLAATTLEPSPQAAKSTLARRVSLDLIGLPPPENLVAAFTADSTSSAYERLVDSLLASPHFGERWASVWLDLARYADSQGYQKDLLRREIWRYRDWVIDAFNRDMPFDQFTIEQLAGDLMPNATENQLLATAFHRNTMTNDEGGTDDEEFRVAAVIDRLNTTFEVWQATTISCVQCHHHPYDPIRHKEYYELYAFLNTSADRDFPDDRPLADVYTPDQQSQRNAFTQWKHTLQAEADTLTEEYRKRVKEYLEIIPGRVPVMQELPGDSSRTTRVFVKGNWLVHGDSVEPDLPDFLPGLLDEYPRNRLGLAKWLVDGRNPLTARVIVNRFWERLFGRGLVETVEDFGSQGSRPTHPELLDWLAVRFAKDNGWSVKSLLKDIVLSATYRQSSSTTPEVVRRDPDNDFLARAPRFRLSAEQIRDQALAISGLLNPKVYGPSVMPYQPDGVWNVIRHAAKWETDSAGDQYRRGIYTFWRRVSPYPSMITFDVPSREVCVSRRIRTNTPLQALVTLNDPVFVDAARALAVRMLVEGGDADEGRIAFGFQLALLRAPDEDRLQLLLDFYREAIDEYTDNTDAAWLLVGREVEDAVELAALVNVANVILNLDELIMKG
ncbi:MAG: DUF1553 domain-containing protein [Rhodothermales bacterium]|nr:DUF1553 domain-containing protein [Rhodothermales bacterium]